MCGTNAVGQQFITPMTSNATNTTQVAGAAGKGDMTQVAGAAGGGGTDLMAALLPVLEQLTMAITALVQALTGSGLLNGTAGGGAAVADANGGASQLDNTTPGSGDSLADTTLPASAFVDGGGAPGKDSDIDSATGAPGKDSGVDSENGGAVEQGGPSPEQVASDTAKSEHDSAVGGVADAKAAHEAADEKVAAEKGNVTKAEAAVKSARADSVKADTALVDAAAAVTKARNGHGSHKANGSQTIAEIAKKYGTSVKKLRELNPSIEILGSLPKGTEVKLPKGVGTEKAVKDATAKLDEARQASNAAHKALDDAIAALRAAREALKTAEAAAKAAKEALAAAQKAAEDAQKAADKASADLEAANKAEQAANKAAEKSSDVAAANGGDASADPAQAPANPSQSQAHTDAARARNIAQKAVRNAQRDYDEAGRTHGSTRARAGDTAASVAARFGIGVDRIKQLNPGISKGKDGIKEGTKLVLPKGIGSHAVKALRALQDANARFTEAQRAFEATGNGNATPKGKGAGTKS